MLVCVNSVQQNIKCGIKGDKYFVDEVETKLRENHSGAAKPRISTIQKTRLDTR
jgi:hypothetical protein